MTALNDLKETCARVLSSLEVVPGDLVLPSGGKGILCLSDIYDQGRMPFPLNIRAYRGR